MRAPQANMYYAACLLGKIIVKSVKAVYMLACMCYNTILSAGNSLLKRNMRL